ncbi:MAG: DNA-3-methyladenine glycosylase [Gemmatimonadota bacterium]
MSARRAHGLGYDREDAAAELARADPRLAALIARVGPCRLEARPDHTPFDWLLRSVVHQQLSGRSASAILGRVETLLAGVEGGRPESLLAIPEEALRGAGLSGAKTASLRDLAARTLDGTVPATARLRRMSDEAVVERLTAVRGVGRWTVEMLLIFGLGRPDVLPLDDHGVRRGYARALGRRRLPTAGQLARRGERWRPWRSVASWYLWRAAELPRGERP